MEHEVKELEDYLDSEDIPSWSSRDGHHLSLKDRVQHLVKQELGKQLLELLKDLTLGPNRKK